MIPSLKGPETHGFGLAKFRCPKVSIKGLRAPYTSVLPLRTEESCRSGIFACCRVSTAKRVTSGWRSDYSILLICCQIAASLPLGLNEAGWHDKAGKPLVYSRLNEQWRAWKRAKGES